ncbi:glycosyl transferase [Paracoccus suum]|uniref:Glycosyl transferase n=1 Tax=Paracoccus suum TaxID=2259340 RepID=A0A344PPE4_9RHOB|nr:glycosyl transferase [Paracoccus suum]AXC51249.1 glycosyl transferase [Paracoccus suum]
MKQIICIKWGDKYGPEHVNRLYGGIARNITPPFRLICFTDSDAGLRPEAEVRPLPDFAYEAPRNTRGKWPKSRLWGDLGDITGVVLFMDLDIIVTGNLDGFFDYGRPEDFILARNPNTPFERLGQTSLYRMTVGALQPLQGIFAADPQGIADKYRYEQRFVTRNAPGGVRFWPRGWVAHFRWHCVPGFPLNYMLAPQPPRGTKVVIFPGGTDPKDALQGRWSGRHPLRTGAADHLRATFDGRRQEKLLSHLRHFHRKADWIAENWRE